MNIAWACCRWGPRNSPAPAIRCWSSPRAGLGSGLTDEDYVRHGAELVAGPEEIYGRADMVIKVKEPQPAELRLLRPGQIVFTYFHLAADRQLTEALLASGCIAVAYETLSDDHGRLPLLDAHERGGRPHEHPGGGQVPGAAADGPRHPAGRGAGGRARPHHHPRRRRGRGQRRQDRRRLPRQHRPPGHQHGPPPLPRRHHAAQRDRALQRPAHHPRAASPRRPGDRRRAGARRQGPRAHRARGPAS